MFTIVRYAPCSAHLHTDYEHVQTLFSRVVSLVYCNHTRYYFGLEFEMHYEVCNIQKKTVYEIGVIIIHNNCTYMPVYTIMYYMHTSVHVCMNKCMSVYTCMIPVYVHTQHLYVWHTCMYVLDTLYTARRLQDTVTYTIYTTYTRTFVYIHAHMDNCPSCKPYTARRPKDTVTYTIYTTYTRTIVYIHTWTLVHVHHIQLVN
jgi:hypothetical protein